MTGTSAIEKHFRTCSLCETMCGIVIEHQDEQVISIKGDKSDPLSLGHICPKAVALQDLHEDPDRLRRPMKRIGSEWVEISWQQAYDEIEQKIKQIKREYGANAIGVYVGNPTIHNIGAMLMLPSLLSVLQTRNRFSATSVDQLPHMLANYKMFGHQLLFPVPDLDRTDYLLMLGANPVVSNGSAMAAGNVSKRISSIRERGGHVTLIDPRRSESAKLADTHLFIRPGTDVFLLAAIVQVLFSEHLINLAHLEKITDGVDALSSAVTPFTPELAADMTGIDADIIRQIARDFANAKHAACYGRMGTSTQAFGGLNTWLIYCINIITGNLDREGGVMFNDPAIDLVALSAKISMARGSFNTYQSRKDKLPEFSGELPLAVLADEILQPGKGQIRAMITHAGNPVLSGPDGTKLDKALASLDFMVAIDMYLNETTRHAHIILPPTSPLEHSHFDLIINQFTVRNVVKYSPALFPKPEGSQHDWQIFLELIVRLQTQNRLSRKIGLFIQNRIEKGGVETLLNRMLNASRWVKRISGGNRSPQKVTMQTLYNNPHGLDLGALLPVFPRKLCTANKHIQLAPEIYLNDLARAKATLSTAPVSDSAVFKLIGRRNIRSNNSWMHNSYRLTVKKPLIIYH